MKKFLLVLILAIAVFFIYKKFFKEKQPEAPKPTPIAVSKHSVIFNQSMDAILNSYYAMSDAFVNWDSALVKVKAGEVKIAIDSFKIDELKKDSVIYGTVEGPWENTKTNAEAILNASTWEDRRHAFKDLSDNLQMILISVQYDGGKVYWQECPMAFGDDAPANWLSKTEEIVNPYLGVKDPKYANKMLHCGETKMTIDFSKTDSATKK